MVNRDGFRARLALAGLGACLGLVATAASAQGLPTVVAEALAKYHIPLGNVSVYVREVGSPNPAVTLNADVPRNPASVMKVVTTLAALDSLGPSYTWRTRALAKGTVKDGRLAGDLIIKGYGDPDLTEEDLWSLLHGLRERGVRTVSGDVVLDGSYFAPPQEDRGDFDGRSDRAYNALPAALSVNFQVTDVHLYPDPASGDVRVFTDPPLANVEVQNNIRLVKAPCRDRYQRPQLLVEDQGAQAVVKVGGTFASNCDEASFARLMLSPEQHLAGALESLWTESGGKIGGRVRTGIVPPGAQAINEVESRPLAEVVRSVNKWSNNLMCRSLLLTLGAAQFGAPGDESKGQRAVKDWLHRHGLDFPELVLNNGSGLSREGRISAGHLGALLTYAYESPVMPEFISSLSVAGVDGTMRKRLVGTPVAGRAHIKTGTLDSVSAVAGFVLDRHDRRWVVVAMVNQPGGMAWQSRQVQDTLIRWVYDGAPAVSAAHGGTTGPAKRTPGPTAVRKKKATKARKRTLSKAER